MVVVVGPDVHIVNDRCSWLDRDRVGYRLSKLKRLKGKSVSL